ncbi:EamA family transporter [Pandoraea terrae]|uniref:EamA family transporter n=1 Tax=Pandoraea terrae TaxID=1537710 RepID=A0A5E4UMT7_9BURK|nr:DMT family transporter [Pandoraea terrae]VVE00185.1 EamA family transporter [Pandoraea terrae]
MTRAVIPLHLAALLFGASALFGERIAASSTMIVFGRGIFAWSALTLICIFGAGTPWRNLTPAEAGKLLLAGAMLAVHWITFFMAVKLGGVAIGTLGFACFPAFVALLEWAVKRERPALGEWAVIGLVSLGLMLVTPTFDVRDGATVGLLWGVVSGMIYAVITLSNRYLASRASPLHASWWQFLAIALMLAPFSFGEALHLPAAQWGWLACLGVLCTALAYTLFIHALQAVKASQAAVVIALEPVYAIALAWLLFGHAPTLKMWLGGACIVGAVAWSGLRRGQRRAH